MWPVDTVFSITASSDLMFSFYISFPVATSGSRGAQAHPFLPQDFFFFKSCSFQAILFYLFIFCKKPLFWANFGLCLPDQNPGSAPGCIISVAGQYFSNKQTAHPAIQEISLENTSTVMLAKSKSDKIVLLASENGFPKQLQQTSAIESSMAQFFAP